MALEKLPDLLCMIRNTSKRKVIEGELLVVF